MLNLVEFFDRLFRRTPRPTHEQETFPQFENDGRELIKELTERESAAEKDKDTPEKTIAS